MSFEIFLALSLSPTPSYSVSLDNSSSIPLFFFSFYRTYITRVYPFPIPFNFSCISSSSLARLSKFADHFGVCASLLRVFEISIPLSCREDPRKELRIKCLFACQKPPGEQTLAKGKYWNFFYEKLIFYIM